MSYRIPSFGYPGGKVMIREWLVKRMPTYGRSYVEPFAGRGNVFWLAVHMLDFRQWHLNDPWTARWFDAIQKVKISDIPDELTWLIARMCSEYAKSRRDTDDLSVALESKVMFSGGTMGGSERAGMSSQYRNTPSLAGFKNCLVQAREIIKSVHPIITDVEWDALGLGELLETDFVYLDPPYENVHKDIYFHDTVDHVALLRYLLDAPHLWMISGYSSPLYRNRLGMPMARKKISKHMQHHTKQVKLEKMTECIWTNYTIGQDGSVVRKRMKRPMIRKKRLRK